MTENTEPPVENPETQSDPEPNSTKRLRTGIYLGNAFRKAKPALGFNNINMILGGVGSFILAIFGFWIAERQSVDTNELLTTILNRVESQSASHSDQSMMSYTDELEDYLGHASRQEARLLQDAVSDDPEKRSRAFRELDKLAQDQKDAIADMSKRAATTYKTIGALKFMEDTNAALTYYATAIELEPKDLESRNWVAQLLDRRGEYEKASQQFETILASATIEDIYWQAEALKGLASINRKYGNFDLAHNQLVRCLALFEEIGNKGNIARANEDLGILESYRGNHAAARERYIVSFDIYDELQDFASLANVVSNLSANAADQGELEMAIEYAKISLNLAKDMGMAPLVARNLQNLAVHEEKRGNLEVASDYASRALVAYEDVGDPEGIALTLNAMGRIYYASGDLDKAFDSFSGTLEIYRIAQNKRGIAHTLRSLGEVEGYRGNKQEACTYHREAEPLFREIERDDKAEQMQEILRTQCGD